MGLGNVWHWVVPLLIVFLLFGRGKISDVMGDFAKGINSFKKGLADGDAPAPPPAQVTHTPPVTAPADEVRR